MTTIRLRSLQLRLAVQLAILYAVATAVAAAILVYQAYDTAETLGERDLNLRAADLAHHAVPGPSGPRLDLPPRLAAAYGSGSSDIFAVRAPDGRLLAAAPPSFGEIAAKWPLPSDEPSYFSLSDFGPASQAYHGLSVTLERRRPGCGRGCSRQISKAASTPTIRPLQFEGTSLASGSASSRRPGSELQRR